MSSELPQQKQVVEVLAAHFDSLRSLGWHVAITDDGVGVCRFFKNGKPRKTPVVALRYLPWTEDDECDVETGEFTFTRRPSARPYRVESPRWGQAKTFALVNSAAACFLDEAAECARS